MEDRGKTKKERLGQYYEETQGKGSEKSGGETKAEFKGNRNPAM